MHALTESARASIQFGLGSMASRATLTVTITHRVPTIRNEWRLRRDSGRDLRRTMHTAQFRRAAMAIERAGDGGGRGPASVRMCGAARPEMKRIRPNQRGWGPEPV